VRIDDRVWVRLPEKQADTAWMRLAELDAQHGLLRRNVLAVDIRNPQQWAFRLPPGMRLRLAIENAGS
jgi:cell division protein FtsQ